MNEETRVIFLDVDGVLNCRAQMTRDYKLRTDISDVSYHFHEPYVRNLSRLYHRYPDTKIILSSNGYRKILDTPLGNDFKSMLNKYDMGILDVVSEISNNTGEFLSNRAEEIIEWLNMHPEINYWVSLDDDSDINDYDSVKKDSGYHLCKTYYGTDESNIEDCGLNLIKTHVALEILGGKYD